MSLTLFKLLAAAIILLITALAGYRPIKAHQKSPQRHFYFGEALASGIFLGAALFHMLPDAEHGFRTLLGPDSFPYTYALCASGFVTLLFLEKVVLQFAEKRHGNANAFPIVLTFVLSLHAITTGAAFGINNTFADALIIFVAIIAHKGSESFALAVTLNRSTLSLRSVGSLFIVFSLMTPIGIFLASVVTSYLESAQGHLLEASFNAIAAGTFLYVATVYGNNFLLRRKDSKLLQEFAALVLGLGLMAVVAIWL